MENYADAATASHPLVRGSSDISVKIAERLELCRRQMAADELKSELCDEIRGWSDSKEGLRARIMALKETDPDMFSYIERVEQLRDGIWCQKCAMVKTIGGKPEEVVSDTDNAEDDAMLTAWRGTSADPPSRHDSPEAPWSVISRELVARTGDYEDISNSYETRYSIDEYPTSQDKQEYVPVDNIIEGDHKKLETESGCRYITILSRFDAMERRITALEASLAAASKD